MKLEDFEHDDWKKIWAGTWSFLTCSHFGVEYTKTIKFGKRPFISQAIIFISGGKSSCWATKADKDKLGKFLSGEIIKDPNKAKAISDSLKKEVDKILFLIKLLSKEDIDLKSYRKFWRQVEQYYHPHIFIKYAVDYLKPKILEKLLPYFEEARVYAEPVFERTEEFIESLAKTISRKTKIPFRLILCLTNDEIEKYFSAKKLPSKYILEKRNKTSVLIFDSKGYKIFVGEDVKKIENLILSVNKQSLKGTIAYHGKATGKVRIVLNPRQVKNFNVGDILVTGMTRPEFLPLIKKAAAFVTDAGGLLSHAAIVAREFKKPCLIATETATKVFKDGDMIEVDAHKGVVRKIK